LVTGGYLLKEPFAEGAEWVGPAGRARITSLDRDVDVAAGHFINCLETTERSRGASPRIIVTTYCPDVGIATISVDDGQREERFELKSFGPHVDINAL
jgi:hypothetical protein